ncbi:MAG: DUF1805 domain-containing protein [Candidatus Omnitrophica bacterium]|nr:DUF1805 domain-containing protein [Candidatus Omnitrophota bacterium]
MGILRKIKVGKKYVRGVCLKLTGKSLIVFSGKKGYIMCGYLNLGAANKFKDVAVKITGVSTINEALAANVHSATSAAKRLGIHKGQAIKDVLKIIA